MPTFTSTASETFTPSLTFTPTLTPTTTLTFTPVTFTATKTATLTNTPIVPHLVISEVAWGGTRALDSDQWIELYNPTAASIDLSNWLLKTADNSTIIYLSGSVAPGAYYLIEPQQAVTNVTADLVYPFASLSVSGETLELYDDDRDLIDTANKSSGAWPAGSNTGYHPSMERVMMGGLVVADGPFAWATNTGVVKNGRDASGNLIYGTPGQRNWAFDVTLTPTATITLTPTFTSTNTKTPTRSRTPTGTVATSTPTVKPSQILIINEVAWMGTASDHEAEWIELWNPGTAAISLAGWKLKAVDGSPDISLSGSIGSGQYYLIAHTDSFQDIQVKQIASFSLVDGGESLQLINDLGVVVDTANPDGGGWPAGVKCSNTGSATPVASTCASMERDLARGFGDTHWYTFGGTPTVVDGGGMMVRGTPGYKNWAVDITATPTKSPTPTRTATPRPGSVLPTAAPKVVINEFLPRAGFDWNQDGKVDVYDEFIEIANLGPINANLTNWKLDDDAGKGSSPYTLPNVTLIPGQHLVIYASQSNVLLSDGGDTVRLLNPNNKIIDAQTYSVVKVEDKSWCRLPDINGSWYSDCFPTPNQRNTREGTVPNAPPGTGLEEKRCTLPDTLPEDFRSAECFGFGSNMWQSMYWDVTGWLKEFLVPQSQSKWETYIE